MTNVVFERSSMLRKMIVLAILFMTLPAVAADKDKALTLYGGYRDGGRFTDETSGERLEVEGSGAVSLPPR